jgi:hypothetical protein
MKFRGKRFLGMISRYLDENPISPIMTQSHSALGDTVTIDKTQVESRV